MCLDWGWGLPFGVYGLNVPQMGGIFSVSDLLCSNTVRYSYVEFDDLSAVLHTGTYAGLAVGD